MYLFDPVDILLVEDNPRDADLTLRALKSRNLANRVVVVRDGEEALEYILGTGRYAQRTVESLPQVVLLDLKLPKVDGLEVLERVRSDARTERIPIIVLSGSREDQDVRAAYRLNANSYIVKPINTLAFIQTIAELGHYWLSLNEPPKVN